MSYGYTLLSESWPVARKQYRCVWCGQPILPGEKYRRERSVYDGEMQDHKWHPECDEQFGIECAAEGGSLEFSPYDNERPTVGVGASLAVACTDCCDLGCAKCRPPGVMASEPRPLPQREFDALLDHIYEHGTAAEGVRELARKLCEAYASGVDSVDGRKTNG